MSIGTVKPGGFQEAIDAISKKKAIASKMNTAAWNAIPQQIKEKSQWSAGVENAKFVQRFQDLLQSHLKSEMVTLPNGQTMMKVGGRTEFVKKMMEFVEKEGIPREKRGTIHDIGGSQRLKLIFDTNVRLSEGYGWWKQGNDPDVLEMFPCQRFVRIFQVKQPRPVHVANTGAVARKDDMKFWLAMNDFSFGGFGVPWGPWGFNSGMGVEDVGRKEANTLGFGFGPLDQITPPDIAWNDHLQMGVAGLSPDLKKALVKQFPKAATLDGDNIVFKSYDQLWYEKDKAKKKQAVVETPTVKPEPPKDQTPSPEPNKLPQPATAQKTGEPGKWSSLPEMDLNETDLHSVVPGWHKNPGDNPKYGGIIFNDQGQILIREPKGHYDGYHWTFAKGGLDAGETIQQAAQREVLEETGHKAVPVGALEGGYASGYSKTYFLLLKSAETNPDWKTPETQAIKWVGIDEARTLIAKGTNEKGVARDLKILEAAFKTHEELLSGKKQAFLKPAQPQTMADLTYVKELGGSTGAKLYRDEKGTQYVVKGGGATGQIEEEYAANQAYAAAGVKVPGTRMMTDANGKPVMVADYIPGEVLEDWWARASADARKIMSSRLQENFVTDALFANWDVLGLDGRNVIVGKDGVPWRIDNGGSFRFRAMGSPKRDAWNDQVGELESMRQRNDWNAKVFGGITKSDIENQVRAILDRRETILAAVPEGIRAMLGKRFDTLTRMEATFPKQEEASVVERIKKARGNGYMVATDKGDIEDNQVLFWEETSAQSENVLRASLKLTERSGKSVTAALDMLADQGDPNSEITVERKKGFYKAAFIKDGFITRTEQDNDLQKNLKAFDQYVIKFKNGTEIVYVPSKSGQYAIRDSLDITVRQQAGDASVKAVRVAMKKIGINSDPATSAYLEYLFIKKHVFIWGETDKPEWKGVENAKSDEALRDKARLYLETFKRMKLPPVGKTTKDYDWKGQGDQFGNWWTSPKRIDVKAETIKKDFPDFYLSHSSKTPIDFAVKCINGGGVFASTAERMRVGINFYGKSSDDDVPTGGASYVFMTMAKGRNYNSSYGPATVEFDMTAILRLDAVTMPRDRYGSVKPGYENERKQDPAQWHAIPGANSGNETTFKHGLSIFSKEFKCFVFDDESEVKFMIDYCKANKIPKWPDGRELDKIFLTRTKWRATKP